MTATEFVPGPKVRGKPQTQLPLDTDETAPKRNGTGPKPSPRQATPKASRSLETQIGATIAVVNIMVMAIPRLQQDALDGNEITALAKAVDLQCKTSPRFRRYIEATLAAGSGAGLLGVCLMIGARRAARHDMIPREFDVAFGSLLAGTLGGAKAPEPVPA